MLKQIENCLLLLGFPTTNFPSKKKINIEAVAQTCSVRKVFLEISQNSRENTCARVSILIKLQAWPKKTFLNRSSHRRCSVRKGVLRNVAKFTGKHLCQSLYFHKVQCARVSILIKLQAWPGTLLK